MHWFDEFFYLLVHVLLIFQEGDSVLPPRQAHSIRCPECSLHGAAEAVHCAVRLLQPIQSQPVILLFNCVCAVGYGTFTEDVTRHEMNYL